MSNIQLDLFDDFWTKALLGLSFRPICRRTLSKRICLRLRFGIPLCPEKTRPAPHPPGHSGTAARGVAELDCIPSAVCTACPPGSLQLSGRIVVVVPLILHMGSESDSTAVQRAPKQKQNFRTPNKFLKTRNQLLSAAFSLRTQRTAVYDEFICYLILRRLSPKWVCSAQG